jgi:predicted CXXCH cytochrome family protein
VDVAREPPDADLDHPPSKRRYQVRRRDGKMWHRELLLTEGTDEVLLSEFPVRHVVGSGRHARTYLVEVDGFTVESPVTWYPSRQAWGMSPGYDKPEQLGFVRAVGEGCLFCHAGRSEPVGQSLHRMRIDEEAIGCERCHGPGSLHVERHDRAGTGAKSTGTVDYTIVNPARLPRERAEAVCQQCHISPGTAVPARGRSLTDFRPGLRLQDFWHPYVPKGADQAMTVTGHVEQMHLSRCYQQSATLTCVTCHDPHDEPRPEQQAAHYRAVCQGCHKPDSCTVDARRRQKESPGNDCVHCHMPRSPTDIPHLAFTHHRIGLHDGPPQAPSEPAGGADRLRPFLDLSHLGEVDRKRSLGLALLAFSQGAKDAAALKACQEQALELLSQAREAGLREGAVDAALAQLCSDLGTGDAVAYAESALGYPDLAGQARCDALMIVALDQMHQRFAAGALEPLRERTRLWRDAASWLYLATCQKMLGDERAREEALGRAVQINPRLVKAHAELAERCLRRGDVERARWHQRRAVP